MVAYNTVLTFSMGCLNPTSLYFMFKISAPTPGSEFFIFKQIPCGGVTDVLIYSDAALGRTHTLRYDIYTGFRMNNPKIWALFIL
jgi:hypothetical protein